MGSGREASEWSLPFTREEYESRLARTREEMERRGLDLLYVTSPWNLNYLVGYESVWYDLRNATGLAIARGEERPVFFDTWDHQAMWPPTVEDGVVVGFGGDDFYFPKILDVVAETLRSRGMVHGRVGLEYWSWTPGGPTLRELATRLGETAEVADGSFVVDRLRLVKSAKELDYVRQAVAIADEVMEVLRLSVGPGISEMEIMGLMYYEAAKRGGEEPATRMMVRSGPRGNHYHAPASRRRLRQGEILAIDMCASFNRYHGNVARAFSLGENAEWAERVRIADEVVPKILEMVRPGTPLSEVQKLMDKHVDQRGLRGQAWWVGGYALGVGLPPEWVGHVYLNPAEGFEPFDFVPGYVTNCEMLFEDRVSGAAAGFIETLIMTEHGIEVPSRYPRTLTVL